MAGSWYCSRKADRTLLRHTHHLKPSEHLSQPLEYVRPSPHTGTHQWTCKARSKSQADPRSTWRMLLESLRRHTRRCKRNPMKNHHRNERRLHTILSRLHPLSAQVMPSTTVSREIMLVCSTAMCTTTATKLHHHRKQLRLGTQRTYLAH